MTDYVYSGTTQGGKVATSGTIQARNAWFAMKMINERNNVTRDGWHELRIWKKGDSDRPVVRLPKPDTSASTKPVEVSAALPVEVPTKPSVLALPPPAAPAVTGDFRASVVHTNRLYRLKEA